MMNVKKMQVGSRSLGMIMLIRESLIMLFQHALDVMHHLVSLVFLHAQSSVVVIAKARRSFPIDGSAKNGDASERNCGLLGRAMRMHSPVDGARSLRWLFRFRR